MTNPYHESHPSDPLAYQPPPDAPPTGYEPPQAGHVAAAAHQLPPGPGPVSGYPPTPAFPGQGGYPAHADLQAPAAYQPPGGYGPAYQPPPAYGVPPPAGYAMPHPYYSYPYAPSREHEGLAIASLVVSCAAILGLCTWGLAGLLGIVGAILGHVARSRIKRNGKAGGGLALAGIIVGWVLTVVAAALIITLIVLVTHDTSAAGTPT